MRPFDDINRLERATWLDGPAAVARTVVQRVLRHQGIKDVLHGVWLGHPLHPGVAQFALGSFTSAAVLDAVRGPEVGEQRPHRRGPGGDAAHGGQRMGGLRGRPRGPAAGGAGARGHERDRGRPLRHGAGRRARGGSGRVPSVAGGVIAGVGALLGGHLGYRQALGANHAEDITHIGPAEWQPLGPVANLPEGEPVRRRAGAVDVVVVRRGAEVTVLADRCSHLSAPLSDGELLDADGDARLVCPWHGSQFRVADGCVVHGPATALGAALRDPHDRAERGDAGRADPRGGRGAQPSGNGPAARPGHRQRRRHRRDPARLTRRYGGAPAVVPEGTPALRTTCSAVWWLGSDQGAMTNSGDRHRDDERAAPRPRDASHAWNSLRVIGWLLSGGQQEVDDEPGDGGEHVAAGGGGAPAPAGGRDQRWHRGLGDDVADERRRASAA